MNEEEIKEIRKKRTKQERCNIYLRRAGTMTLNLVILGAGWVAIVAVNLYQTNISDSVKDVPVISSIATLLPGFVISFVNGFVPITTKMITKCEKWDFASQLIKQ